MATRVTATKTGLKLVCEVSAVPVPRPRQVFPLPDIHGAGWPFLTLASSRDSNTGIRSLIATVDSKLPGASTDTWTLRWSGLGNTGSQAAMAGRSYTIVPVQDSMVYTCRLVRQDAAGNVTLFPTASLEMPHYEVPEAVADLQDEMANLASDNILSPSEKPYVVLTYTNITNEKAGIDAQADASGASRVAYDASVSALTAYLGTLPGWNMIPGANVPIVGTTFRQKFADVSSSRQALLNAIAGAANTSISTLNSDDTLSRAKKPQAITDYNAEVTTRAQLQAAAMACSPAVDHSAYTAALDTLASFLGGLTPAWNDISQDTPLGSGGGATMRSRWATIAQQRTALQVSISSAQATKASNDAISTAANDAASKVSSALVTAANDATAKAAAQKQAAIDAINTSVAGMVTGATSAADAVSRIMGVANAAAASGAGSNLLANTDWQTGLWPTDTYTPAGVSEPVFSTDRSPDWTLVNAAEKTAYIRHLVCTAVGYVTLNAAIVPITAGKRYIASVYSGAHRCKVAIYLAFRDASGTWTKYVGDGQGPWLNDEEKSGGKYLDGYKRIYATLDAPAGSVDAYMFIRKFSTRSGETDSFGFFVRPMLEEVPNTVSEPSPWVPSATGVGAALATANAAQTMPTYASPAALPAASGFAPGYGPVLTLSDYSLWHVNAGATAWDRILFGAEGIFGKVTVDQLDVTDTLRAAIVDAPHVNAQLLTLMDASVVGGKTVIGPGSMDIDAIRARTMTLVGDNLIPNPSSNLPIPSGGWPAGYMEGASLASDTPSGQVGSRKLTCSSVGGPSISAVVAKFPAAPGDSFYASAMVYANIHVEVAVEVDYYDGSGTPVGNDGTPWDAASWAAPTWLLSRNGSVVAPSGTASAMVRLYARAVAGATGLSAWFGSLVCRKMNAGELDVDGSIATRKLSATAASTANFAQAADDINGGVYAATGACMMVNTPGTPALIVDSAGLKIGKRPFTDYWFRLLNAIDGSSSSGLVIWRGNNDPTVLCGAPVIASDDANPATSPRLLINTTRVTGDYTSLRFQAQPITNADNLDALTHVEAVVWMLNGDLMSKESAIGYPAISSRRYAVPGTPTNQANAGNGAWTALCRTGVTGLTSATYPMILQCRLCNVYGDSAQHYYLPPAASGNGSTSATGRWTDVGTAAPYSGGVGGGGAGGGGTIGGGGCPAPWVRITLASGLTIDAGSLIDGMQVVGVDEQTLEPAVGIVREPHMRWVERVRVVLEDGRTPEFTDTHRVALASGGWAEVRDLKPGDLLVAQRESRVRAVVPTGKGQVISFTVEGCHTYFSEDILSHNVKTRDV